MKIDNKNIIIFFDDKKNGGRKEGKVTETTTFGITIDDFDIIPLHRIIRIEKTKNKKVF